MQRCVKRAYDRTIGRINITRRCGRESSAMLAAQKRQLRGDVKKKRALYLSLSLSLSLSLARLRETESSRRGESAVRDIRRRVFALTTECCG